MSEATQTPKGNDTPRGVQLPKGIPASSERAYVGRRSDDGAEVWIVTRGGQGKLPMRNDVINHSPDGPEWGYAGSGPAQLALAICIDALDGDVLRALPIYQLFKQEFIARQSENFWTMPVELVRNCIAEIENNNGLSKNGGIR